MQAYDEMFLHVLVGLWQFSILLILYICTAASLVELSPVYSAVLISTSFFAAISDSRSAVLVQCKSTSYSVHSYLAD